MTNTYMTNQHKYSSKNSDDDDDMSLADIMSLRISTPTEEKNSMMNDSLLWNDWTFQQQNELMYQQQIQASYYQLHYLQQQQMLSMMRNSTSSRRSSTVSSKSSINSNNRYHRSLLLSPSTSNTSFTSHSKKSSTESEPIKRRQSLGKRIKKVFGMTEVMEKKKAAELPKFHKDSALLLKKNKEHFYSFRASHQLPSPASSTVSTVSTTSSKKSLSFNPVIKINETFSSSEYDRRSDITATCQKLTPDLALKIKEELNNFKLNDMFVHNDSRQYTHFFM